MRDADTQDCSSDDYPLKPTKTFEGAIGPNQYQPEQCCQVERWVKFEPLTKSHADRDQHQDAGERKPRDRSHRIWDVYPRASRAPNQKTSERNRKDGCNGVT